jgi:hypothetical protein
LPRELVVAGDLTVRLEVNGQMLNLRVDPGLNAIILNPGAAARVPLRRSAARPEAVAGPTRLIGQAASARVRIGSWSGSRALMWFDRDAVQAADGIIGVAQLPHESVTLQLRTARSGERQLEFVGAQAAPAVSRCADNGTVAL